MYAALAKQLFSPIRAFAQGSSGRRATRLVSLFLAAATIALGATAPADAQVARVYGSSTSATSTTSRAVSVNASYTSTAHAIVVMVAWRNTSATATPTLTASGWTAVSTATVRTENSSKLVQQMFYREHSIGTASYTITASVTGNMAIMYAGYTGADLSRTLLPGSDARNVACTSTGDYGGYTRLSSANGGSGVCLTSNAYDIVAKSTLPTADAGSAVFGGWSHYQTTGGSSAWSVDPAYSSSLVRFSGTLGGAGLKVHSANRLYVTAAVVNDAIAIPSGPTAANSGVGQIVILQPPASGTSTDLSTANNTAATYSTGTATTITMTMTNTGTNIASGAGWTAALPGNFATTTWTCAVSGTGSCGTGSGSGNTATLANIALNTGSTATITFTTTPTTAGTANATSVVTVPSGWTDSASGNNSSTVSTTLSAAASAANMAGHWDDATSIVSVVQGATYSWNVGSITTAAPPRPACAISTAIRVARSPRGTGLVRPAARPVAAPAARRARCPRRVAPACRSRRTPAVPA